MEQRRGMTEINEAFREKFGEDVGFDGLWIVWHTMRAASAIRRYLERGELATYNITWSGLVVLTQLWLFGDSASHEIANQSSMSKGTLTGIVSTLESHGWLVRARADDRRVVMLSLTPAGEALVSELLPKFQKYDEGIIVDLPADDREHLIATLRTVIRNAEADLVED
ncbi:MAG: MarR family winged helix-turn-helix transcriptional regulator [Jatrophihabitans sp.]